MQPPEALAFADQLPALAVRADQQPVGRSQVESNRAALIFRADIVVAFPHAKGITQQTLAHPVSLSAPHKRQNFPDEPLFLDAIERDSPVCRAQRGRKMLHVQAKLSPLVEKMRHDSGGLDSVEDDQSRPGLFGDEIGQVSEGQPFRTSSEPDAPRFE